VVQHAGRRAAIHARQLPRPLLVRAAADGAFRFRAKPVSVRSVRTVVSIRRRARLDRGNRRAAALIALLVAGA